MHTADAIRNTRRGFTLTELAVTIGIILVLIALVIVGYSTIIGAARAASNQAAVSSIGQGVETFRNDFDSRPPPLITRPPRGTSTTGNIAPGPIFVPQQLNTATERAQEIRDARYYSEWTLATFLLGDSDVNGDGVLTYNEPGNEQPNLDDGHDGPGFRDPGELLAWKRRDRNAGGFTHSPAQTGRVYGPYVESGIEDFVETVDLNGAKMQRFIDSYGNPMRYYLGFITREPSKDEASSAFMPQELQTYDAARTMKEEVAAGNPFFALILPRGVPGQEFHALSREVINADYVILAANDKPENHIDQDGNTIAPYGDVAIGADKQRIPLDLLGSVNNPGSFMPGILNDDTQIAFDSWLGMIETNLRYTP